MTELDWDRAVAANAGLRGMYDAFIEQIAKLYPGKSLLDFACNNGYFPVAAERLGMKRCAGIDQGAHHAHSIDFLNGVFGTRVEFFPRTYSAPSGAAERLRGGSMWCASRPSCAICLIRSVYSPTQPLLREKP